MLIRAQGLFELTVILFFVGVFIGNQALIMIGGVLMVTYDVLGMCFGVLNPLFPVLFALFLSAIIKPWYLGLFWSSAVFSVFGVPTAILKIIRGDKLISQ